MKKLLLSCLFYGVSLSVLAEVAVIVNPANTSTIDKKLIKKIFTGKVKSFPSGNSVVAINQASANELTAEFNDKVLNKSSSQIKAYWSKQLFTGKGTPPKEVDSDSEVIKLVASDPNMIGYVSPSSLTDKVKVVGQY
ncbi:phosphate ABC transporter substrate-binding protein [Thalassotalea sp. G2M2-11]|uniref:phosphate ABC transporter substrate-binding protein n=1 Tax=Thalassotalea sp. G2M2-11 TaxID=2787627 RepID=UPI0019D0AA28|nr:phosphate ABC transporter substrate-binding protein [Thalassotalea sp. G2M2-11]